MDDQAKALQSVQIRLRELFEPCCHSMLFGRLGWQSGDLARPEYQTITPSRKLFSGAFF